MLWAGIRLYSREQYEGVKPEYRFILTPEVREYLHPDIPETYLDKSLILIPTEGGFEIEVEGENFLAVDDKVVGVTIISLREAERRFPDEVRDCRQTGSSLIAKLFQDEQNPLLAQAGYKPNIRRGLFGLKKKTLNPRKTVLRGLSG